MCTNNWQKFYDKGVNSKIDLPSKTIYQILVDQAKKHADLNLLVCMNKKMSFKTLITHIDNIAQSLVTLGVRKGDRITFLLPNLFQFPIVHFAILKIGAISVPVNPLLTKYEIEKIILISGAKLLITLDRFYNKIDRINETTSIEKIVISKPTDLLPIYYKVINRFVSRKIQADYNNPNIYSFKALLKSKDCPVVQAEPLMDEIAVLLCTGGTTGSPKLASLTHRNLIANSAQVAEWVAPFRENDDTILAALPFFHSFGLTLCLHMSLITGTQTVLIPRFSVKAILKAIQRYRINYFPGVPTMFVAINDDKKSTGYDFSSLKMCISGGFELNPEVQNRFEQLSKAKLIESYGLTEATPAAISTPISGIRKSKSIGIPLPSTDAKIVDQVTSEELSSGEIGELIIKGPQVMKGYWNNPDETKNTIREGWLFTGDLAKMDEDGFFYIVGRIKELIKYSGFNIFPQEVEEVLLKHECISEAGVSGISDKKYGEIVVAFIKTKPETEVTEQELIEHCKQYIAKYKLPREIHFVENLPRNFAGKVLRRQLSEHINRQEI